MADYPISNVPRRVQYVNTGVGPYLFNFEILTQTDIAVYRGSTLLTLTTDYTVTINTNGTGSVTLTTAGTGNITIVGARAIQRTSDYTTNGDLFANTLNVDLDSQTIYSQQLAESLDRSIKAPVTDNSTIDLNLPSATSRANKVFAFDSSGSPQVSSNTLAAIDSAVNTITSIAGASPGSSAGISHIASGTGAVATTVQAKLREAVSVKDFGAVGDGVTDDTTAIQNAINSGYEKIIFPEGVYITTAPLYIDGGITLEGENSRSSYIKKTTTTVGTGSNTSRGGVVTDTYAVNAILILRHPNNSYTYGTIIRNMSLNSDGYIVDYGIYAPRTSQTMLEDVDVYECRVGWYTFDSWLCNFTRVTCNSNTIRFGSNNYGWSNATPSYGFVWDNDGTNSATGTTLVATDCWARDCHFGWTLYGLQYSVLNGCGSDNISRRAYRLHLSSITLNGCGMENVYCLNSGLSIESGQTTINNFNSYGIFGSTDPNSAMVFLTGTNVSMSGCRFDNFVTPDASANIVIQSNTELVTSNTILPTNGNSFISYSSGSQWVDLTFNPPIIRTAGRNAYLAGDVRGNQLQQKINKSIASGGTVIATFTAAVSAFDVAVCEFTVSWSDNSFPSATGIDKFLVAVYQDTAGTNYRENISTVTSATAGNTGGTPTAPTYSISRSGAVWSLTMTPAHGACTAYTITAEMQNISGITLALP
mgnify:CR=1 FL=1